MLSFSFSFSCPSSSINHHIPHHASLSLPFFSPHSTFPANFLATKAIFSMQFQSPFLGCTSTELLLGTQKLHSTRSVLEFAYQMMDCRSIQKDTGNYMYVKIHIYIALYVIDISILVTYFGKGYDFKSKMIINNVSIRGKINS